MRAVQYRLRFETIEDIEKGLTALRLYSEEERRDLPPYIVKTHNGKLFVRSESDLKSLISQLCSQACNLYIADFIIQPFLISTGQRAKRVEISWDSSKGTTLRLLQSPVDMNASSSQSLLLSGNAEIAPAKSSICTEHLKDTLFLVKAIVEKAAFKDKKVKVEELRITMMQDCHNVWYFIGLEAFRIAKLQRKPKIRMNSPDISQALSTTLSPKSLTHRLRSFPTFTSDSLPPSKSPVPTLRSPLFSARPHSFHYSKAYLQQLEVEEEVSKLLPKDSPSISNITYSAWRQRTQGGSRLLLVDRMYAQAICKQRRLVSRQSQLTLKQLKELREKIALDGEEALFQAEMEARISGKAESSNSPDLAQFTRFAKARRQKLERTKSLRMQQDGISRVIEDSLSQYSAMMARVRATKLATLSTSADT